MSALTTDNSVRELFRRGIAHLREAHVPSYTLAAEILLLHATDQQKAWLYSHPEEILPDKVVNEYLGFLARRSRGEPTQHITGKQEFWGLEFAVTPDVLIPRPETEHLIEVALDRLAVRELRAGRAQKFDGNGITVVDIGTGSGCIAIALAKDLPDAEIYATDISSAALAVAQRNASRHGFGNRIRFLESNLLAAFSSPGSGNSPCRFDLIASNPPYISRREASSLPIEVREHEPATALYGGEEGYELYSALILQAARHLKSGGLLVLELGHDSLPAVRPLLETTDWENIGVTNDLAGIPRVLSAERT